MQIRQNTRRTAFAMLRRGFWVSDAALGIGVSVGLARCDQNGSTHMATSSILWNENAACTMVESMAMNRSVCRLSTNPARAMAPGLFQYRNPSRSRFGPPPRSMIRPAMINPIINVTVRSTISEMIGADAAIRTLHAGEKEFG